MKSKLFKGAIKSTKNIGKSVNTLFNQTSKRNVSIKSTSNNNHNRVLPEYNNAKLIAKAQSGKIHVSPNIIGASLAQVHVYLKEIEKNGCPEGFDPHSHKQFFQSDKEFNTPDMSELNKIAHHFRVTTEAFANCLLPTVHQTKTIEMRYADYVQSCKEHNQEALSFSYFQSKLIREANNQGVRINHHNITPQCRVLLQKSITIGPYKYEASSRVLQEMKWRNFLGHALQIKVGDPLKLFRVEGRMGKDFFENHGSVGMFFSAGIPVVDVKPGQRIHPLDACRLIGAGLGIRQTLTHPDLVKPASAALKKIQNNEKPTPEELEKYKEWMSGYYKGKGASELYVIDYTAQEGEELGIGTGISDLGNDHTSEFYPIEFNINNAECRLLGNGTQIPVIQAETGKQIHLTIDDTVPSQDFQVAIDHKPHESVVNTHVEHTHEELLVLIDTYHVELKKLEQQDQQVGITPGMNS